MSDPLGAAVAGKRLEPRQIAQLWRTDLPDLLLAAGEACRQRYPAPVRTYVIDRNINYTNVCVCRCRFCAFWRPEGHPQAYLLDPDTILAKVEELVAVGGTQVMLQGGLNPKVPLGWVCGILRVIKERFPVHLHSLSPPEIVFFAHREGLSVSEVLARLHQAGLDSLPGGGAEVLAPGIRDRVSPAKCTVQEWLEVMAAAAGLGMSCTATMMFGHGESDRARTRHLLAIRALQDQTRCFTAFIPWTYQPGNTALGGEEAGGHAYLRTLAVSRLVLDNIPHVQASWVTQGLKLAAVALHTGADDMGGTMMEENVVRAAGARPDAGREQVVEAIISSGFTPALRDTYYRLRRPGDPLLPAPGR